MKSYEIKTTKDILKAVDEKNIEGFLKDFEAWLRMTVAAKNISPDMIKMYDSSFTWNDDNDYGTLKSINIEIKS